MSFTVIETTRLRNGWRLPVIRLGPHECPYKPGRQAMELAAFGPHIDGKLYQLMMDSGFRRSGAVVCKTDCDRCRACVPIRVPVNRFVVSKSQRRVLRRNEDVEVRVTGLDAGAEHYALHSRYQAWRHRGTDGKAGAMAMAREEFEEFFGRSPISSAQMELRAGGRLVGVGLMDLTPEAVSSVYFYSEPEEARRSLGVFSSLMEIEECKRRGLAYYYLGYIVKGCAKMEYKSRFTPSEYLWRDGTWRAEHPGE